MAFVTALLGLGKALLTSKVASSVVGGVASHVLGQRAARKERANALQDDATRFTRLREGAEAAGFNPLTALEYGGTNTSLASGVAPPLASQAAIRDIAQDFGDLISGREAQQRVRDKLETDLAKVRLEQAVAQIKSGSLAQIGIRPRERAPLTYHGPSVASASKARNTGFTAPGIGADGSVVKPDESHTFQWRHSSGESTAVPIGPDLDEVLTGFGIAAVNRIKAANRVWQKIQKQQGFEASPGWLGSFGVMQRPALPGSPRVSWGTNKSKPAQPPKSIGGGASGRW